MHLIFSQLCLAAGLQLAVTTGSPVEKVVELIKELKGKIETDAANEQKIYDKFACWCEETTQRKADAIVDEKQLIGTTTTKILTLKGKIATLASEVADCEDHIAKNDESMKEETGIRTKENGEYQAEKDYMETTLSALHHAIEVLSGAGTGGDKATEYPEKEGLFLMKVASQVRSAILGAPQLEKLPEEKMKVMKRFLEEPVALMQNTPEEEYYDQKAQAKASYSPQSATVTGILKDMYDTFAADLEKANGEESKFQKAFEDHIAVLEKSTSDLKREIVSKQEESAAKAQALSEAEATLAATLEQKDTDETIFSSTRDQCKMKSDEWDERGRLRTEQLSGINKALEILTSDEARGTFQEATGNRVVDNFGSEGVDVDFLQVDQKKDPREKAFLVLKQMSRGTSNLRLARLAAAVRTTATGHFDEVIGKIDDMDAKLKQEGLDDVIQRDWCIKEQHFNQDLKSRKEYDISQLEAKILRTEEAKANMLKKQDHTREQLKELQEMWKQAGEDRVAESAQYTTAKNDDTMAISLLADAIAAFSAYGENNAVLLQVKKSTKKQPVFEVSEDQAPDASFSGKENHKGAQDAVVMMMTQIKENLENEVALADKAEEKALVDHATLETEVEKQEDQYDKYIIELDNLMAEASSEIERLTGDKTKTEEEHTATVEYLAEIKPNCEWIKGAFELRANARAKEHKGLLEAKAILAGAVFVQEDQTMGFLQKVQ
jgi:hypothetical protein